MVVALMQIPLDSKWDSLNDRGGLTQCVFIDGLDSDEFEEELGLLRNGAEVLIQEDHVRVFLGDPNDTRCPFDGEDLPQLTVTEKQPGQGITRERIVRKIHKRFRKAVEDLEAVLGRSIFLDKADAKTDMFVMEFLAIGELEEDEQGIFHRYAWANIFNSSFDDRDDEEWDDPPVNR